MTTTRGLNAMLFEKDKKKIEKLNQSFKEQMGEPFESINKYCSEAYADLLKTNQVEERIVSDLYRSQGCLDRSEDHSDDE